MKTNQLFKVLLILLIPIIYLGIISGFKSEESFIKKAASIADVSPAKDFINLIFTDTYFGRTNPSDPRALENNIINIRDSLHFNSVHIYGYGNLGGGFDEPIAAYKDYVNGLIGQVNAAGLRGYWGRNKIERLSYGQRIEYEVGPSNLSRVNSGFSYDSIMSNTYAIDSGRTVLHARPHPSDNYNPPGYLCKSIYENLQHGDLTDFTQLDDSTWFIKPVMRIDSNVVDNNPNAKVIRIDVFNYKGIKIDSIIIRANNFKDESDNYGGQYISNFSFDQGIDSLQVSGRNDTITGLNYGMNYATWYQWKDSCKVDFRVYWFGEVEVWFDKMIVDDVGGNNLFHPNPDLRLINETKITEEALEFTDSIGAGAFYIDELTHSQIPSVKRVYELMREADPEARLHFAVSNFHNTRGYKDNSIGHSVLLEQIEPVSFHADIHLFGLLYVPNTLTWIDPQINPNIKVSKATYNDFLQKRVFGDKSAIEPEGPDNNYFVPYPWGSFVYQAALARTHRDENAPGTKFIVQPQIHGLLRVEGDYFVSANREPLNEEIEAQAMLSIAHGAEGLCWFIYYGGLTGLKGGGGHDVYGLLNPDSPYVHRHYNHYGQDKWNAVGKMNKKIEHWKPALDNISWQSGWSVHKEGADHNFISDIKSIYSEAINPYSFLPENEDDTLYWEMGFFEPDDVTDKSKYFMMVNRRCIPDENNQGDFRQLRIKFDSTQLAGFINWKITDLDTNNVVATFNKNTADYINMGVFNPGEGKLYKIAPVMQEGGTLVFNESFGGVDFVCKDTVISNGKNITITGPTTAISFDNGVAIMLSNANFYCGRFDSTELITFKGIPSTNKWSGLSLNNANVKIYNSKFQDIASPVVNYAVKMLNCPLGDIRNNEFVMNSDTAGGINSSYSPEESPVSYNLYINYNIFTMNNSRANAIKVQGFSDITLPLYIQHNQMTSNGYATGIMLSSITGGVISHNNLTGFSTGMNVMFTYADFYNNAISNTSNSSTGIFASSNSMINLSGSNFEVIAGSNSITNTASNSKNINVQGAQFLLHYGFNTFDIASENYHLYGTFPTGYYFTYAQQNCFKINGSEITSPSLPLSAVYTGGIISTVINFNFIPYNCEIDEPENFNIVNIGNGLYDTIPSLGEGFGGGEKGMGLETNNQTEITQCKDLYDSIRIEMRFRNYESVKRLCYELIDNYPDSSESVSSLLKLYLSELKTDSTTQGSTDLKSYYESLILNNSENEVMVSICNYLIQKCKVRLREYQSALNGFQNIIDENPYSYDGLLARWDYAATSLMMQGSGGGERDNYELGITNYELKDFDEMVDDDPNEKYNRKAFSKEQKKIIKETIYNVNITSKKKDENKISLLEERVSNGDKDSKNELRQMKVLKEVNKSYKPEDVYEHLQTVNNDIYKVFGNSSETDNKIENTIPTEYNISQNYPNPFNPTTKISFDLPEDGTVKLFIYDMLGREILKLVNNELKTAGRHTVEFNGVNLASGVYFYRLEVNKFVQTKRMVLIK